jgi:PleD family two-component response regulator
MGQTKAIVMKNTPAARLLDVGNCDPDHAMVRGMLEKNFNVQIDRVMFVDEALERMRSSKYALVLFNRLTFADGSDAIELLKRAKQDAALKDVPIMMISNFEKAQSASISLGGERGFGKAAVSEPETIELLSKYLPSAR